MAIYHFDQYLLDDDLRELSRNGKGIAIQPRVYELLLFLIENRERSVSKDELIEAVWPGQVITDAALARAIMKARKAVDDDATQQRAIKTVMGHGYRFVAEVREQRAERKRTETSVDPAPPQPRQRGRWISVAALLAAALGSVWLLIPRHSVSTPHARIAVLPTIDRSGQPELAWVRLGLMGLVAEIMRTNALLVVSEKDVMRLVDARGWYASDAPPEPKRVLDDLAGAFGATHFLKVEVERQESTDQPYALQWVLRDQTGVVSEGVMQGDSITDLAQEAAMSVVEQVLPTAVVEADVAPLLSGDPFLDEAFARASSFHVAGDCPGATPLLRVVHQQRPGLFLPLLYLGDCARISGQYDEAIDVLDDLATSQLTQHDLSAAARAMNILGIAYHRSGNPEQARSAYLRGLDAATQVGDEEARARLLINLAIIERFTDSLQALELLDRAAAAYRAAEMPVAPHYYSTRANIYLDSDDVEEAARQYQQAIDGFERTGDIRLQGMMLNNMALLEHRRADYPRAELLALRSLELRERIGDRVGVGRVHGMLSNIYTSLGQHDLAESSAANALALAIETNDWSSQARALVAMARSQHAQGRLDEAAVSYGQARELFVNNEDLRRALQIDLSVARMTREAGETARALRLAEELIEHAEGWGEAPKLVVEALEFRGQLATDSGEYALAADHFTQAMTALDQIPDGDQLTSGGTSLKERLSRRLVYAFVELGQLEQAEPLVGFLTAQSDHWRSLMAQAAYAAARGDMQQATTLAADARERAGDAWGAPEQRALEEMQAAVSGAP